jgi:TrpR-related protein YerC/YecD
MKKWNNQKTRGLFFAILALKSAKEAEMFFRDLMTESELFEFGNRWQAARMLAEKKIYLEIQKETKLSTRTIARISTWLKKGQGGYRLMINRLHHQNSSQIRKKL